MKESVNITALIESEIFKNKDVYKKLLSYLIHAQENNIPIKEISIAIDVFEKDSDFNPSENTLVRVHMHHLRKLVEQYYRSEGKKEKIRVEIPRGRYEIKYVRLKNKTPQIYLFLFILVILIGAFILINYINNKEVRLIKKVWKPYFKNNKPKMVILGDHYFFGKYNPNEDRWHLARDISINSAQELEDYIDSNQYNPSNFRETSNIYAGKNILLPFKTVTKAFFNVNKDYSLRLISEVNIEDMQENNIIFIGLFKTLGHFKEYVEGTDIKWSGDSVLSIKNDNEFYTYHREGIVIEAHNDFCLISKCKGRNNNTFIILASFHDTGIGKGIDYLVEPENILNLLEVLKETFGDVPEYFDCLIEVKGVERLGFNSKILMVRKNQEKFMFE